MSSAQLIIISVLVVAMAMFLWGRLRYDLVAMAALLVCVLSGVVPGSAAFAGFGHPAVITVACVLVLGYGLQLSGAMDILTQRFIPTSSGPTVSILALISLAALLSAFINNVGALALLMPIAIQMAAKQNLPAGKVLMPLAFGSILGGMVTLIGTPPNLIVSGYREEAGLGSFAMFDFAPVGLSVAVAGILFIGLIGWRLVPSRKQTDSGKFDTGTYLSEVRIDEGSKAENMNVFEVEKLLDESDAQVVGLVRNNFRISAPNPRRILRAGDILVIEVDPASLPVALTSLGLKFEEEVQPNIDANKSVVEEHAESPLTRHIAKPELDIKEPKEDEEDEKSAGDKSNTDEIVMQELVVMPGATLVNRSATHIELRTRYGINLLAISRQGRRSIQRLRSTSLKAGDVLLMQGMPEAIAGFASQFGCLPLATRDIHVPKKGLALKATLIMALVVAATALGIVPTAVAFATGALAFAITGIVPLRSIYTSIDWSVVVLLAAMLPIAGAMASTGAADMIAHVLLDNIAQGHAIAGLILMLVLTMFLSDLMNNAATAAVMCPIGISTAAQLGVNADAFLMAIAVGASCAFLTPIGHQNNTLILGPGGFRFGDYWRLGLLLEVIVVAVSIPMLLLAWPL
jgi:di/tricarboxylate transporter